MNFLLFSKLNILPSITRSQPALNVVYTQNFWNNFINLENIKVLISCSISVKTISRKRISPRTIWKRFQQTELNFEKKYQMVNAFFLTVILVICFLFEDNRLLEMVVISPFFYFARKYIMYRKSKAEQQLGN